MCLFKFACLIGITGALALVGNPQVVAAGEMVRAYVLIDSKPGQLQAALQSLDGLGNCLAMTHSFMGNEFVAHLHCDSQQYLNTAITDKVTKSDAVARVTVLAILTGQ